MRAALVLAITFAVILAATGAASARTWYILPDGSGDAPTIQAGIDSCGAAGDTVFLAPGTYIGTGNKNLDSRGWNLVLRSEAGPKVTIIDCEGDGRALSVRTMEVGDPQRSAFVEGLLIVNGSAGAIYCENYLLQVTDCTFSENSTSGYGGAIACVVANDLQRSSVEITDCTFFRNSAGRGGAIACMSFSMQYSARATATDCGFLENSATDGGAVFCSAGWIQANTSIFRGNSATECGGAFCAGTENLGSGGFTGCVLSGNSAAAGGAIYAFTGLHAGPDIIDCTFSGNAADYGAGIYDYSAGLGMLENTIIAFSPKGQALDCTFPPSFLGCCDIYGNAGGDWVGCIAGQNGVNGNFSIDPLFCLRWPGDYCLDYSSPCAPGNHPYGFDCGLIGAAGVGCDQPTAIEHTTWGRIKSMFR